jgi:hypothetical protein
MFWSSASMDCNRTDNLGEVNAAGLILKKAVTIIAMVTAFCVCLSGELRIVTTLSYKPVCSEDSQESLGKS